MEGPRGEITPDDGKLTLTISLENSKIDWTFGVMKSLKYEIVMGINLLMALKITTCFNTLKWWTPAGVKHPFNPKQDKSKLVIQAVGAIGGLKSPEEAEKEIISELVEKLIPPASDTSNQDQARYYNKKRKDVKFNINDLVTVKKHTLSSKVDNVASKLAQKYKDPGRITKIISPVIYEIENEESKKLEIVHVSDIKPFNIDSELESENDSDYECTEAEKNETVSAPEPKVNNIAKDVNKDIETVARPSSQSETTTPPSTEASEAEAQAVDKENYAEHDNAVQADDIKTPADHTDITVIERKMAKRPHPKPKFSYKMLAAIVRERSITYVKDDKEDIAQTISKNEAKSHDELVEKLRDFVDNYEPLRKPIRKIKSEPWYLDVETVVGTKKQKEDSGKVEIETKTRCEKAVKVAKTIDDEMCWNCRRNGHQYTICDRRRTRLFCIRCGVQNVTVKTCKNDRCIEIARKKAAKNKKQ
uniref:CCHC-type domain-containing protein n=1 Tax=Trichogramma kaykai TaxID=54128 RepID=A0ABD2W9P1_9HYME